VLVDVARGYLERLGKMLHFQQVVSHRTVASPEAPDHWYQMNVALREAKCLDGLTGLRAYVRDQVVQYGVKLADMENRLIAKLHDIGRQSQRLQQQARQQHQQQQQQHIQQQTAARAHAAALQRQQQMQQQQQRNVQAQQQHPAQPQQFASFSQAQAAAARVAMVRGQVAAQPT
jgi:hypothetical protein